MTAEADRLKRIQALANNAVGFRQLVEDHGERLSAVDRLKYEALSNAAGYALAVELLNAGSDQHGSR